MTDAETREAFNRFTKQVKIECSECGAPVGALCDAPGVWIHLQRFKDAEILETRGKLEEVSNSKNVILFAATSKHDDKDYWFVPRDEETVCAWAEEHPEQIFFFIKLSTDI